MANPPGGTFSRREAQGQCGLVAAGQARLGPSEKLPPIGEGWAEGLFSVNGQASLGDRVLQEQGPPVSRDISDLDEGMEREWWVFTEQAKECGSLWSVTVGPLYP